MTMRNPLIDAERNTPIAKTFDPAKRYRYTWPGQSAREVDGAELTAVCAGANVDLLAIEEIGGTASPAAASETPPADESAHDNER